MRLIAERTYSLAEAYCPDFSAFSICLAWVSAKEMDSLVVIGKLRFDGKKVG
jgi:hypothetical protein